MKRCLDSNDDSACSSHKLRRTERSQTMDGVCKDVGTNSIATDFPETSAGERLLLCNDNSDQPTVSGLTINHLPPELLLRIFSYLSHVELVCSVVPVSPSWRSLALDFTLWRRVSLDGMGVPTSQLADIVRSCRPLQTLTLHNRSDLNAILPEVVRRSPGLQSLELVSCRGAHNRRNVSADALVGVLRRCESLGSLTLTGVTFRSCRFYRTLLGTRAGERLRSLRVTVAPNAREFQCLLEARAKGQLVFNGVDGTFQAH